MAYPTADDLLDASSLPELTQLGDAEAEAVRAQSIAAIESFCGQSFVNEPNVTRSISGTGDKSLLLPKRLHTLSSLSVYGSSLDAGDVFIAEGGRKLGVILAGDTVPGNWYEQAIRDAPPYFPWGDGVATVTGDWGWSDDELDPDDLNNPIALALRLDMEASALAIANPATAAIRAAQKLGVPILAEGPLTVRVDQTAFPMTLEVQELLRPYRWQPGGFSA